MKKCKCGGEWGDDASFCGYCGDPLEKTADVDESKRPYYHFVMYGNEGVEGYKVVRSEKDMPHSTLTHMELRARMNSHRNIKGYAFKSNTQIEPEAITKTILKKAEKIF